MESTALVSSAAPLLLVCMARPELVERRPTWPAPLRLEPLQPAEADALIGDELPEHMRRRVAEQTGGNPLFITEMVALAKDGQQLSVPPTLKALLAARLDQLNPQERSVLERGAVEGEIFHRGAVQALASAEPELLPRITALVRHGLISSARAQFPGEDAFRFRHLLIRDAAYDALPKSVRADMHRRLADWLEAKEALVELDEVAGYHLEQASGYQAELGRADPALALRAGDRLLAAARRASDRADGRAAITLFERGLCLTRPLRCDVHAELDLASEFLSEPVRAAAICEDVSCRAEAAGDEIGAALGRAIALLYRSFSGPGSVDELESALLDVRPRLEAIGDHAGLAQVWWALGFGVANGRDRADDWATAAERAYHHRRLAGRAAAPSGDLGPALVQGSRPADQALAILDRHVAESSPTAWLLLTRAWLLAMLDRGDEVRETVKAAEARLREPGQFGWGEWLYAEIDAVEGNYEAASERIRGLCNWLEETQQVAFVPTMLARLGRWLCQLCEFDEAEQIVNRSQAIAEQLEDGAAGDYHLWNQVRAHAHAQRGEFADAEALAREAVELTAPIDRIMDRCHALWDLAEVLESAGRIEEATVTFGQALEGAQRKQNLALARQIQNRLAELKPATDPTQ